jgi:Flp pilus assembly protein CpaB
MRTNKNISKIILALTVAFLATAISFSAFKNMNTQLHEQKKLIELIQKTKKDEFTDTYAYAISTDDLKAGEIVSDSDVDFKQFEIKMPEAFDNRSDIVNKVLLKDLSGGDVFTTSHIAKISNDDLSLKEGYRALTLPSDNFQGKSEKMLQGSLVDIYSASSDNDWVLEGVKILSFEAGKKALTKSDSLGIMNSSAITFEVSTDSISDFISNISKGKLVLVARNSNDKAIIHKKAKSSFKNIEFTDKEQTLPNIPDSVPISNFSDLPQPVSPEVQAPSVELIEANVKSKVTFEE